MPSVKPNDSDTRDTAAQPAGSVSRYWRVGAVFCVLVLAVGLTAGISMYQQFAAQLQDLQHKVRQTAQLQYVAVLMDDKGAPAMLLTQLSGEAFLQLQRLNAVAEGGEDTMQLWALADGGAPRSLGTLTPKLATLRLTLPEQALSGTRSLAISVESKGGVSESQGPRLPYLFTGSLVHKAL